MVNFSFFSFLFFFFFSGPEMLTGAPGQSRPARRGSPHPQSPPSRGPRLTPRHARPPLPRRPPPPPPCTLDGAHAPGQPSQMSGSPACTHPANLAVRRARGHAQQVVQPRVRHARPRARPRWLPAGVWLGVVARTRRRRPVQVPSTLGGLEVGLLMATGHWSRGARWCGGRCVAVHACRPVLILLLVRSPLLLLVLARVVCRRVRVRAAVAAEVRTQDPWSCGNRTGLCPCGRVRPAARRAALRAHTRTVRQVRCARPPHTKREKAGRTRARRRRSRKGHEGKPVNMRAMKREGRTEGHDKKKGRTTRRSRRRAKEE